MIFPSLSCLILIDFFRLPKNLSTNLAFALSLSNNMFCILEPYSSLTKVDKNGVVTLLSQTNPRLPEVTVQRVESDPGVSCFRYFFL